MFYIGNCSTSHCSNIANFLNPSSSSSSCHVRGSTSIIFAISGPRSQFPRDLTNRVTTIKKECGRHFLREGKRIESTFCIYPLPLEASSIFCARLEFRVSHSLHFTSLPFCTISHSYSVSIPLFCY